jgi:hypothetical protein
MSRPYLGQQAHRHPCVITLTHPDHDEPIMRQTVEVFAGNELHAKAIAHQIAGAILHGCAYLDGFPHNVTATVALAWQTG